jgi:cell division protease FtsH
MDMLDEIEDDEEPEGPSSPGWSPDGSTHRSKRIHLKNLETVRTFLGKGRQHQFSVIRPAVYGDLLALALKAYIEKAGWQTVKVIGYASEAPDYDRVETDYDKQEDVLCRGYLLLQKDDDRVVVSVRLYRGTPFPANVVITGRRKKTVRRFAECLHEMADGRKMYQGKNIELGATISFLGPTGKSWEDLALDPELKDEIRVNTVEFLARTEELAKYGIIPRRGVILSGEPGTGKTLVSKVIMSQSPGITCILAWTAILTSSEYIRDLYQVARDLMPSIVFLEDIDLIGENRRRLKGTALPTLLAQLDGIAETCNGVVTVATTNFIDDIDDALKKRPARFDRIIELPLPNAEQRRQYASLLSRRIPMDQDVQEYLARKTEGLTPAQIQEVAQSLVIEHKHSPLCTAQGRCTFTLGDVDRVLELVRHDKKNGNLGFARAISGGNHVLSGAHILNSQ